MNVNQFEEFEESAEYVKFWPRAGAYILDGIIIGFVTAGLNYVNIVQFKSFLFYLVLTLLAALYKPYFEHKFGATFGKMILKIKVVDYNFKIISFNQSLLRSAIFILPSLIYIPIYYFAFKNPNVLSADGFLEFSQIIALEYPIQSWIGNIFLLIIIIDIIFLLSDSTKTQRSLHDQIAKTYVVYDKKIG